MDIYFDQSDDGASREYECDMKKALSAICLAEGLSEEGLEVSISFVTPKEIQELNREHRNVDKVTDVLSFPQYESKEEMVKMRDMTGVAELGDVVICSERAKEQAKEYGHSERRETIYLFVHSVLHLLGYDHMEEEERLIMREREEEIMHKIGITR